MLEPPIPANETQRIAALRSLDVLFTPAEERFDRITRMASRVFGTEMALVSLIAEQCQWFKSAHGLDASETPRELSFCAHAILGDETFVVEDATQDKRFADNPFVTTDPNVRFYAGHPLHTKDGSRVGTLCVIDSKPRTFTQEEREVLRDLAAIVETELQSTKTDEIQRQLIRERNDLQRKAMIDGLTHLWNRNAFMELLGSEMARANRGVPMCVALIDADHFKRINDTYGHQAGDAVLVEIAVRIRRAMREFDAAGRYGGEEFIALFSNCGLDTATAVAERIRSLISKDPIDTPTGSLTVTVSIGLAVYDPAYDNIAQIIAAADAALYRAKHNGRNRIEF